MGSLLGRYSVVQAETPRQGLVSLGILLQEPETDSLRLRFRRDLESLAPSLIDEEDLDVLLALGNDLAEKAREMGGRPENFWKTRRFQKTAGWRRPRICA